MIEVRRASVPGGMAGKGREGKGALPRSRTQSLLQPVSGAAEKIRCTVVLPDGELSDEAGISFERGAVES